MLADAYDHVKKVIVAVGYTDLRKGIDGLAQIVGTRYHMDPFEKDILFLFCGKRCDRIKGLLWEGDGYFFSISDWKPGLLHGRVHRKMLLKSPQTNIIC